MMSFGADKPWLMLGLVREQLDQAHRDGMLAVCPPRCERCGPNKWDRRSTPSLPTCDDRVYRLRRSRQPPPQCTPGNQSNQPTLVSADLYRSTRPHGRPEVLISRGSHLRFGESKTPALSVA